MSDKRLFNVSKPARYIGGELNSFLAKSGCLNFCLIFPDIYEIGSSHVGYRLLYDLVNKSESISCQRFFAPWTDALALLKEDVFCSLEERKPLKDFDVLGFSMQYEMCYTTVLAILKHSGIPLRSAERDKEPIIMAGGSCTYNPAPMSAFIDAFYIGEGDLNLRRILEGIKSLKDKNADRLQILKYINSFDFMFVPSIEPDKIVKRDIYAEFPESEGCKTPFLPIMPAVHDRVSVEIARGCTAGCRFCQAGIIYRPVRERSLDKIVSDACSQIRETGHQEVSLLSLSTGDFSQLEPLVVSLNSRLNPMHVSLSTPSLRADSVSENLFREISRVRKSGWTIAPEAGTERMRRIINKNLTEEDILKAVISAAENGYNGVKLYFMIGLPLETDEDILGIATLVSKIKNAVRRGFDISVSVSHFVPKPHTPFQCFGQVSKAELERRMYMLKDELKRRKFKFKFHDIRMSVLEAVMSRGDKRLGDVLEYAVEQGFYLDSWDDFFDFDKWVSALGAFGLSPETFACKEYNNISETPWSNIRTGVSDEFYESELKKAYEEASTPDCRRGKCSVCGVCDFKTIKPMNAPVAFPEISKTTDKNINAYQKYELIYEKKDSAVFLSALELNRIFCLALRVAGADLKYSEGFNPLPKVVMYLPLPVGMEGDNEKLLFEAFLQCPDIFMEELFRRLPRGIKIKSIKTVSTMKIGTDFISSYRLGEKALSEFKKSFERGDCHYMRRSKDGSLKRISVSDFFVAQAENIITLKATSSGGFNLIEFFKTKGLSHEEINITRISINKADS